MAAKRYELNDRQWAKIASLLPGKSGDPGRTGDDNDRVPQRGVASALAVPSGQSRERVSLPLAG